MKLIYIIDEDYSKKNKIGIYNKVFGQIKYFLKKGIEVYLIYSFENSIIIKDCNQDKILEKINFKNKYLKKIYMFKEIKKKLLNLNANYIYVRYPKSTKNFIDFLKTAKFYKIETAVEFPTYPYNTEIKSIKDKILSLIDFYYRNKMKKYVKFAVNYAEDINILDINTIKIENGIDLDNIKFEKEKEKEKKKELILLCLANLSFWHGYDKIIKALNEYYTNNKIKEKNIKIYIVGEGEELFNLKKMVKENKLEEFVIFYGMKTGIELDEIFKEVDIGIGTLGGYRKNLFVASELKCKEYCARGIPFVMALKDNNFNQFKYAIKVENNDSDLDLAEILNKYNDIIKENNFYREEMREYAIKNLSWDDKIEKILKEYRK